MNDNDQQGQNVNENKNDEGMINQASNQSDVQTNEARENLKAVLEVGIAVQTIAVIVTFAIKKNKEEFLRKVNDLFVEFQKSLTEEEMKELGEDINMMIDQKAGEIAKSMGEELTEEELNAALTEIRKATEVQANS